MSKFVPDHSNQGIPTNNKLFHSVGLFTANAQGTPTNNKLFHIAGLSLAFVSDMHIFMHIMHNPCKMIP